MIRSFVFLPDSSSSLPGGGAVGEGLGWRWIGPPRCCRIVSIGATTAAEIQFSAPQIHTKKKGKNIYKKKNINKSKDEEEEEEN